MEYLARDSERARTILKREIYPAFSLVELLYYCALIGRQLLSVKIGVFGKISVRVPLFRATLFSVNNTAV